MNKKFFHKLESLVERFSELEVLLGDQDVISEQTKFTEYAKEYHQLQPLVDCSNELKTIDKTIESTSLMLKDDDQEVRQLAEHEIHLANQARKALLERLQILLLPTDPDDQCNVFLEIRAGTGGDEAAIFCGDLLRMYLKYAEIKKWQVEIVSSNPSEQIGRAHV